MSAVVPRVGPLTTSQRKSERPSAEQRARSRASIEYEPRHVCDRPRSTMKWSRPSHQAKRSPRLRQPRPHPIHATPHIRMRRAPNRPNRARASSTPSGRGKEHRKARRARGATTKEKLSRLQLRPLRRTRRHRGSTSPMRRSRGRSFDPRARWTNPRTPRPGGTWEIPREDLLGYRRSRAMCHRG